jgi:flagellar hook-associated protein 1 FlgK
MSISASLSNALSGLTAVGRIAETVSSNIANASTKGYAPREVVLTNRSVDGRGAGVIVAGINRHSDPVLLADRRDAGSLLAQITVKTDFLSSIEGKIGYPDDPYSLTGRMSHLDAALIEASSRPDSDPRLQSVFNAASALASHLNEASDAVQTERMRADQQIARSVEQLNTSLQQIAKLNAQIVRLDPIRQGGSDLFDQRQRLIDGISEIIPIRELPRQNNAIALMTQGGTLLLDLNPAKIEFSVTGTIVPEMSLAASSLSGLVINGKSISTEPSSTQITGGRLSALFNLRDEGAPAVQRQLDAVARDLIERFEDPTVDATLSTGDPGLFTDNGSALSITDELGLSGRITINPRVDPETGGALWRLRDGIGAITPGSVGDSALLNNLGQALNNSRVASSGGFTLAQSAMDLAGDLLSQISVSLHDTEIEQSYAISQSETLIGLELQNGVDTDVELQKLLMIEQSYAANARVISTIDEMIQSILRI